MSWVQWQGKIWETTPDEASLHVHIEAPDAAGPRVEWRWELAHIVREEKERGTDPYLGLNIEDLGFRGRDWTRFANTEIRADAAWHDAQENTGAYGRLRLARLQLWVDDRKESADKPSREDYSEWLAHDFVMRIGQRDGFSFPCELDAWMIPAGEYFCEEPEQELAPFPSEPPNLRVMTSMVFLGGGVDLPRCGDDPLPMARRLVREETGFDEMRKISLKWWLRQTPDHSEIVEMPPGWRSSVHFGTKASKW